MRLMVIVGSVRPGRVGLPVANWAAATAGSVRKVEVDLVDLAELALPFMDEAAHPRLGQYEKQHTKQWSARVTSADAFLLVAPEYNHSYSPALKNALDFLNTEWKRKPVSFVSYGGVSAGTRGATALKPVLAGLGLVPTLANVEINFAAKQLDDDGAFVGSEQQETALRAAVAELEALSTALRPLRG